MIKTLRILMEKVNNLQEQMANASKMEMLRNNQREMLENKSTVR